MPAVQERQSARIAAGLVEEGILPTGAVLCAFGHGVDNQLFTVRGVEGEQLVVKTPRPGRSDRYPVAAWAARFLRDHDLPAPRPVWHAPGLAVETLCDGRPLSSALAIGRLADGPKAALQQAGAVLRQVHRLPVHGFGRLTPLGYGTHPSAADWLLSAPPARSADEGHLAAQVHTVLREHANHLPPDSPRLLHGDFTARHVLASGGVVRALVDLESVRGGDPMADLGGWTLQEPAALSEVLLDGYFPRPPGPDQTRAAVLWRLRIARFSLHYHLRHRQRSRAEFRARQIHADLKDLAASRPRLVPALTPSCPSPWMPSGPTAAPERNAR